MFRIEYLIYVYILLCACMIFFNIVYMLFHTSNEKYSDKSKSVMIKKINLQFEQLKNGMQVTEKHKKYLYRKLKRTYNLMLFDDALKMQEKTLRRKYLKEIQSVFCELALYYEKTDSIKKVYFAYIIETYKIGKDGNSKVLLDVLNRFLKEESIYCRDRALRAIISFENVYSIINALQIINKLDYYYHPDTIFLALLEFSGFAEEFALELWKHIYEYREEIQIAFIRYVDKLNLDYKEEFYYLVMNYELSLNVQIEIIKYFKNNRYGPAKQMLINNTKLKEIKNEELVVESARALQEYDCQETREALKSLLVRKNWKMRMVASESLLAIGTSYYDLVEIYNGEDEVARGILKYQMQNYNLKKYRKLETKGSMNG